jgi:hypothetical protein
MLGKGGVALAAARCTHDLTADMPWVNVRGGGMRRSARARGVSYGYE